MRICDNSIYQIYPLGFCGAPHENDGVQAHRILKVLDWTDHFKKLDIGAVLFNPVFESDTHGYDTRDYRKIDVRLGTNDDFKRVCDNLHNNGIKVILDGVFNHTGRNFRPFQDVLKNKWNSSYKDWFHINFDGNDAYNDGFWYEGWEGNYNLVKLNLGNPDVKNYLFDCVGKWIDDFGIDGLRLDVAYCLDRNFIRELRNFTESRKRGFYLLGEMIHGNYIDLCGPGMCDSVTNYECYKGLYSSFNSMNMFEITHSLLRQKSIYPGIELMNFADNHDVSRIASTLNNERHLPLLYVMLFTMPGLPCIYYGSEWGAKGTKSYGDYDLRPCFDKPVWNELCDEIAALNSIRRSSDAFKGSYNSLVLTNRQCVFERAGDNGRIIVCINADENEYYARFDAGSTKGSELLTGKSIDLGRDLVLPAYTAMVIRPENP